jgi:NADH-quinone oxidoreductase subunit C
VNGEKPSWLIEMVSKLSELGIKLEEAKNVLKMEVSPESLREAAKILIQYGYDHLASISGVDWPTKGTIEVIYFAESYEPEKRGILIELKTATSRENPKLPSLIDLWPNALFLERETWEMFGVVFEGNPDLRRLLLPPDWSGPPPLRKDYKVVEEGIYVEYE